MESNGSFPDPKHGPSQKLLPKPSNPSDAGRSPVIKIRIPGKTTWHRTDSIKLKRFDLLSDDFSPFQAAREGRLITLKNCRESGENLHDIDVYGFSAIHHATRANRVEIISFLLDSGVDPDTKGGINQLTPLHISVRFINCLEATKFLISHGADPYAKSTDGTTPLHFAARRGDKDVCKLLLGRRRLNVNVPDNSGATAFHLACASDNAELCAFLLDQGADVLASTAEGRNSLHIAASYGHAEIAEKLIKAVEKKGVEKEKFINSCDSDHNTPLHLACKKGHLQTVKVLLKHNADLESRNDIVSNTPLHVAAQTGQVDIVKVLIYNGASVTSINALRRLPIHLAALFGHWEVIQCLLGNGSPIDPQDGSSLTPLLTAVSAGRLLVVERLIQLGADTGLRNESLQTCIHIAVQNQRMDMLELLVNTIGNEILDVGDKDLRLPLHHCAYAGIFEMLQFILSKTSNPHPKDIFDKTPFHMAAENGNIDCVKALAEASPLHIGDTDDTNTTPFQEAAKKGHRHVCNYLLRLGADVTSKDSNRWTALHHAASSGHVGTVKALLQAKTVGSSQTIDEQDSDGNTPLILAARNGQVDVVRLLIDEGADITIRNNQRMTCLDEAVELDKLMVVMEIVRSKRWYGVVSHRPHEHKYPMKTLIEKMPQAAKAVFDRCIKYSNLPLDDPEFSIECDFRLLDSSKDDEELLGKKSTNHFFAPTTMIKSERENLLSHPLVKAFLSLRWKRMAKPILNFSFLLYLAFILLFTQFLVTRRLQSIIYYPYDNHTMYAEKTNQLNESQYPLGAPMVISIILGIQCLKDFFQLLCQGFKYFKNMTNYLQWSGYILAWMFIFPHLSRNDPFNKSGALWPLGASAVLLMYFTLILSLRCFGSLGIYISMFIEILKTMGKVVVMFSVFVFSFGLVFFTLLKEQKPFRTVGWSVVKTKMLVIGDMDYDGMITSQLNSRNPVTGAPYVPAPEFTAFILMVFGFVMIVLFMNLLIGLTVGDIDSIQRHASFKKTVMEVEFIVEIEERYPRKLSEMLGIKEVMVFTPNKRKFNCLLLGKLYNVSDSIFNKEYASDKEDDLAEELREQKSQTKSLRHSLEEQHKLLVLMSKQLQVLSGASSPTAVHLMPLESVDINRLESTHADLQQGAVPSTLPPSLL